MSNYKSVLQQIAAGTLFAHVQAMSDGDPLTLTYDAVSFGGSEDAIPLNDIVMAMSIQEIIDQSLDTAIAWHITDDGDTAVAIFGDIIPLSKVGLTPDMTLFDIRREPDQIDAGRIIDLDSLLGTA